ncbi:Uncharacterised protein [Clostridium perfringens]|nr:Uncharacterised protein [Clostridium perfringens]
MDCKFSWITAWKSSRDRNAFTLKNVMNDLYAKDTGQGDLVSKPGKESYWYYGYTRLDANGKLAKRKPSNPEDEWSNLLGSMNDYFLLSNNHTGDANAVEAQTFYLYKKVTTKNPSIDVINTNLRQNQLKYINLGMIKVMKIIDQIIYLLVYL